MIPHDLIRPFCRRTIWSKFHVSLSAFMFASNWCNRAYEYLVCCQISWAFRAIADSVKCWRMRGHRRKLPMGSFEEQNSTLITYSVNHKCHTLCRSACNHIHKSFNIIGFFNLLCEKQDNHVDYYECQNNTNKVVLCNMLRHHLRYTACMVSTNNCCGLIINRPVRAGNSNSLNH